MAEVEGSGAPTPQYQPDVTHHRHLADLLRSVAAETAALERSGLREEELRFLAEVRATQLAGLSVHSGTAADLTEQASEAQTPHADDAASHGLISCSTAPQAATGECACSYQQHTGTSHDSAHSSAISDGAAEHVLGCQALEQRSDSTLGSKRDCDSLASALTAVVDFLLHGVLSMQPSLLQSSYAGSALSFITAVQAACPGECKAMGSILDLLSSGLLAKVARGDESCSGLAADLLQELLEMPQTGQAVFRVAAKELRSAFDALSDKARDGEASGHGQMQNIEALCDVLDAVLLKLPDWLSHPDVAISSAPSHESLSQVLLFPDRYRAWI
ncbi:g4558 [Coccomyxa viridis]|uniref:G4558 protein n=1 Tax=Coccomyxa viridis TaxID=1274662 RepID=A0ABP1FUJ6_9CHLO